MQAKGDTAPSPPRPSTRLPAMGEPRILLARTQPLMKSTSYATATVRRGMRDVGAQPQMGEVLLDDVRLVNRESVTKEANYGVG